MLTVLISTITAFIIAALVNYFESKPHGIKGGQWFVIFMVSVYGLGIGAFVAYQVPQKYEVSERNVYYILEDSIYIQPSPNEITFFTEGDYGEPIPMNFKVDTVSIKHTNDKISQIEVIKYVGFNKFSLEDPKVTVNVLMSSNPHHGCGFFEIKKTCGMQVEGVIGRCQKQIILITAYSRNRTLPKSQGTNLCSCKVK